MPVQKKHDEQSGEMKCNNYVQQQIICSFNQHFGFLPQLAGESVSFLQKLTYEGCFQTKRQPCESYLSTDLEDEYISCLYVCVILL